MGHGALFLVKDVEPVGARALHPQNTTAWPGRTPRVRHGRQHTVRPSAAAARPPLQLGRTKADCPPTKDNAAPPYTVQIPYRCVLSTTRAQCREFAQSPPCMHAFLACPNQRARHERPWGSSSEIPRMRLQFRYCTVATRSYRAQPVEGDARRIQLVHVDRPHERVGYNVMVGLSVGQLFFLAGSTCRKERERERPSSTRDRDGADYALLRRSDRCAHPGAAKVLLLVHRVARCASPRALLLASVQHTTTRERSLLDLMRSSSLFSCDSVHAGCLCLPCARGHRHCPPLRVHCRDQHISTRRTRSVTH